MKNKKPEHEKAANKGKIKISIMIPAHNNERTIEAAIRSALDQNYPFKEIVVVDDMSYDSTVEIAKKYEGEVVRVFKNDENLGIGVNLAYCMSLARAPYVVYLCGDDLFADKNVCKDIADIFDTHHDVGVIDRHYYQFMDGKEGAVTRVDEDNIYISSCCPSGMAFRKMRIWGANRIFIEMPLIVVQFLQAKWSWVRMSYDTVAVRIHPGGNTGTLSKYYTESPTKVYTEFLQKPFDYYPIFIQLKNRAPKMVWSEIKTMIELNPECKKDRMFWVCAIVAVMVPGFILRRLSAFYRNVISRSKTKIVARIEK